MSYPASAEAELRLMIACALEDGMDREDIIKVLDLEIELYQQIH